VIPTAQTVGHQVWSGGTVDSHGNPVDTWAPAVEVAVYAYGPPAVRGEPEPSGTEVITHLEIYAPEFTVDPRDRFVVEGVTYETSGDLNQWSRGPFGYTPGIVIRLKRVEGGP
jgi:hypothetical protein